ncbi:MAG: PspC domain-containing protein [Eubacterium sp.]
MNMKKLYRDPNNKSICGVCSGIAKYLNVDTTVIRLLWVLAIIFCGFGVPAYFICALVIPEDPNAYVNNEQYWQQQQNQQYYQNNQPNYQQTYYDPNQQNNGSGTYNNPDSNQQ